jgi:hypothetical protein
MKRHLTKDLNSRLKPFSKHNSSTLTFQSRLQEIIEFVLLSHKETIEGYILTLQRNTEQEYLLEEDKGKLCQIQTGEGKTTIATNNSVNPTAVNLKEDFPSFYKSDQELVNE